MGSYSCSCISYLETKENADVLMVHKCIPIKMSEIFSPLKSSVAADTVSLCYPWL